MLKIKFLIDFIVAGCFYFFIFIVKEKNKDYIGVKVLGNIKTFNSQNIRKKSITKQQKD